MRLIGIILTAILFGVSANAAAAETTLRISLQLPLASHLGQNLVLFKDEVEAASAGEIVVEIYDSAQLYKDKEVPAAVGSGSIEMGVAALTRYVGDIPAVDIFEQPFLFDSEEKVREAVAKGSAIRELIDEAIEDTGSTVLWWQAYGSAVMLSKRKPIATPQDMKGKRTRVFGKTAGDFVIAAGGVPTLISGSEQYLAYQRRTVDIGMTGISGIKSRRLWEVMDTITVTNHADIEFVVVINTEFWNGLPAIHRTIIAEVAANAETDVRNRLAQIEADAYAEARENGMTVYTPTSAEIEKWKAISEPVYDTYLKKSGELGATLLETARAL